MIISKIKKINIKSEKVYRSENEYHDSEFVLQIDGDEIKFSSFELGRNYLPKLENTCRAAVFKQILNEGRFRFEPKFKGFFDTYVGQTGVDLLYCIVGNYLIVATTDEQSPNLYWMYVEGVWEILEKED